MIEIVKGSTQKPISSQQLIDTFSIAEQLNGLLYVGYPIFSTPEGRYPIDAIFISPTQGVIIIHLVEGRKLPDDYKEIQDDIYNKLESKFRNHKSLMKGRKLNVPISIVTFAPAINSNSAFDTEYPICSKKNIISYIESIENNTEYNCYKQVLAVIQAISSIRKGIKKRNVENPESKGAKLQKLEDSIANLDNQQGKAVIETIDAVQRIRGLAGSGKTIVLALKAAYLHAQHPNWKIAVTFHTRSLKEQFKRLINTFTIEQTGEEPDWENLKIIHSWGSGQGEREGIYFNFCDTHNLSYLDFGSAKHKFGMNDAFAGACSSALNSCSTFKNMYDVILIDEAQDFPLSFLQICYHILGNKKRLVYAYDELQSLSSNSLPNPETIFGKDNNGIPLVTFKEKSQDIILEKCYRNSKPVLTSAHALGFGIYREADIKTGTGLIQMFDNSTLWSDVGYVAIDGPIEDGKDVILERTENSSPKFLESHSEKEDLIQFKSFSTEQEQREWLTRQINININQDELRFDDIIVINPNPLKTKNAVGPIRADLFQMKINSHLAGVDTSPDVFFRQDLDSIAFTGIYRAKGNEAGMVYIINAQDCYDSYGSLSTVRNQLFTAITRSKGWVRVLGVGLRMEKLEEEFNKVKDNSFRLNFNYPDIKLREKLNIVNRDMSDAEKKKRFESEKSLKTLLKNMASGDVLLEDLDAAMVEKVKEILLGKK